MKKRFLFFILLFLAIPSLCEVLMTSFVNKTSLNIGDNFTFTISVEGLDAPIKQPILPEIKNGVVKGQYQTVEPQKNGFKYLYHYIISPLRGGKVELEDFVLKVENKSFMVDGFSVSVKEEEKVKVIDKPEKNIEIYLEGRLEKNECFEGEFITYSLHLLTRDSVRNFEFTQKPSFDGFRKIEMPSSLYPKTVKVERKGKYFLDAVVYNALLCPLKNGNLKIDPFTAVLRVEPSNSQSKVIKLMGGNLTLKVNPLPPPPKGFRGAVGKFSVKFVDTLKEISVKEQEIFSIKAHIEGKGNLPSEPFELSSSPFFTFYPLKSEDTSKASLEGYLVKRDIILSFAPLVGGKRSIGNISFVYFDVETKKYEILELPLPIVNVTHSLKSENADKKGGIIPILDLPNTIFKEEKTIPKSYIIFLLLPFLFTFIICLLSTFLEKLFLSKEKMRVRDLERTINREIKRAKSKLDSRSSKEFHTHLRKSLECFIEKKILEPVSSLTTEEIGLKLKEKGFSDAYVEKLVNFIREIDTAEFSTIKVQKNDLKRRLYELKSLIKEKRGNVSKLLLLIVISFSIFGQDSVSLLQEKAKKSYLNGNYEDALKYYKIIEDAKFISKELYFNIGNSYFEMGNIPYAIYYYKKALKIKSDMKEALSNLKTAKDLTKSKLTPYEPSPIVKFLLNSKPSIFFFLALTFLIISNIIFSLLRIFTLQDSTFIKNVAILLLVFGLLFSFLFYKANSLKEIYKEGVILEEINVFQNPDPKSKSLRTLPGGSEVFVTEISPKWVKVKWGEGEGYVDSSKVGII